MDLLQQLIDENVLLTDNHIMEIGRQFIDQNLELTQRLNTLDIIRKIRHDELLKAYQQGHAMSINMAMKSINSGFSIPGDLTPDDISFVNQDMRVLEVTISSRAREAVDQKIWKYEMAMRRCSMEGVKVYLCVIAYSVQEERAHRSIYKYEDGEDELLDFPEIIDLPDMCENNIKQLTKLMSSLEEGDNLGTSFFTGKTYANEEFCSRTFTMSDFLKDYLTLNDPQWKDWHQNYCVNRNDMSDAVYEYIRNFEEGQLQDLCDQVELSVDLHKIKRNDHTIKNDSQNHFFRPNHQAILKAFLAKEKNAQKSYIQLERAKPNFHFMWSRSNEVMLSAEGDTKGQVANFFFGLLRNSNHPILKATSKLLQIPVDFDYRKPLDNPICFADGNVSEPQFAEIRLNKHKCIKFMSGQSNHRNELEDFLHIGTKKENKGIEPVETLPFWDDLYCQDVQREMEYLSNQLTRRSESRHNIGVFEDDEPERFQKELIETDAFQMVHDCQELWLNVMNSHARTNNGFQFHTCSNKKLIMVTGPTKSLMEGITKDTGAPQIPYYLLCFAQREDEVISGLRIIHREEVSGGFVYLSQAGRLDKVRVKALSECAGKFAVGVCSCENTITKAKTHLISEASDLLESQGYKNMVAITLLAAMSTSSQTSAILDHFRYLIPNCGAFLSNGPGYIQEKMEFVCKTKFHIWLYHNGKAMLSNLFEAVQNAVLEKVQFVGDQPLTVLGSGVQSGECPTIFGESTNVRDYADSMCILYTLFFSCPKAMHYWFHRDMKFHILPLKFEKENRLENIENPKKRKYNSKFYFNWNSMKYTTFLLDQRLSKNVAAVRQTFYTDGKWDQDILIVPTLSSLKSSLSIIGILKDDNLSRQYREDPEGCIKLQRLKQKKRILDQIQKQQESRNRRGKALMTEADIKKSAKKILDKFMEGIESQLEKRQMCEEYLVTSVDRVIDNVLKLSKTVGSNKVRDLSMYCLDQVELWIADIFAKGQRTKDDREIYRLSIIMKVGLYMYEHFYKAIAMYIREEVISESGDEKIVDMQKRISQATTTFKQWKDQAKHDLTNAYIFKCSLDMTKWSPSDNSWKYVAMALYSKMTTSNEKSMLIRTLENLRKKKLVFNHTMMKILKHMMDRGQLTEDNILAEMLNGNISSNQECEQGIGGYNPGKHGEKVKRLKKNWVDISDNWFNGCINYASSVCHVQAMLLFEKIGQQIFDQFYCDPMVHSDDNFTICVVKTTMSELDAAHTIDAMLTVALKEHGWKLSDKKSYIDKHGGEFVSQININQEQKSIWHKAGVATVSGVPYTGYETDINASASKIMGMSSLGAPKSVCEVAWRSAQKHICNVYGTLPRQRNSPESVFEMSLKQLPISLCGIPTVPLEILTLYGPAADFAWKVYECFDVDSETISIDKDRIINRRSALLLSKCLLHNATQIGEESYDGEKVRSLIQWGQFVNRNKLKGSELYRMRHESGQTREDIINYMGQHPSLSMIKVNDRDSMLKVFFSKIENPNFARSYASQRPEQLLLERIYRKYKPCCTVQTLQGADAIVNRGETEDTANSNNVINDFDEEMSILEEGESGNWDFFTEVEDFLEKQKRDRPHENSEVSSEEIIQMQQIANNNMIYMQTLIPTFEREKLQMTLKEAFVFLHKEWEKIPDDQALDFLIEWWKSQKLFRQILKVWINQSTKVTNQTKKTRAIIDPKRYLRPADAIKKPVAKLLAWGLDRQTALDLIIPEDQQYEYELEWLRIRNQVKEMIDILTKSGVTEPVQQFVSLCNFFENNSRTSKVFFVNMMPSSYEQFVNQWISSMRSSYYTCYPTRYTPMSLEDPIQSDIQSTSLEIAAKAYLFLAAISKNNLPVLRQLCNNTFIRGLSVADTFIHALADERKISFYEKRKYLVPLYYLFDETDFHYKSYHTFIPIETQVRGDDGIWTGHFVYFYKYLYDPSKPAGNFDKIQHTGKGVTISLMIEGYDDQIEMVTSSKHIEDTPNLLHILTLFQHQMRWRGSLRYHIKLEKGHRREWILIAKGWNRFSPLRIERGGGNFYGLKIAYNPNLNKDFEVEIQPGRALNHAFVDTFLNNQLVGRAKKYFTYSRHVKLTECTGSGWVNYMELNNWFAGGFADDVMGSRHFIITIDDIISNISQEKMLMLPRMEMWEEYAENYSYPLIETELQITIDEDFEQSSTIDDVEILEGHEDYILMNFQIDSSSLIFQKDREDWIKIYKYLFNLVALTRDGIERYRLWNIILVALHINRYDQWNIEQDVVPKINKKLEDLYLRCVKWKRKDSYRQGSELVKFIVERVLKWYEPLTEDEDLPDDA